VSYFNDKILYIIVPTDDLTNEMENNVKRDYNSTRETFRKNIAGTEYVLKVRAPISSVFNGYEWLNQKDILVEMAKPEWTEGG